MPPTARTAAAPRLIWPDTVKGLSILWIAYFHGFKEYAGTRFPGALSDGYWEHSCAALQPTLSGIGCLGQAAFVGVSFLGYHAVGVFILLSGFALSFGQSRKPGPTDWWAWYRSRFWRLFPLYWVAHLIYLVSPGYDPIDYRFALSLLGDRVYPLPAMAYYANPAWWYFGLLVQLYLVFPLLFRTLQRCGSGWFLVASALITVVSRYLLLFPLASGASEALLGGALFTSRLFEFSAGMALGAAYARDPQRCASFLGSFAAAVIGGVLYVGALYSYAWLSTYVLTDALIGVGLGLLLIFLAIRLEGALRVQSLLARVGVYSYGLYLLHQPFMIWFGIHLHTLSLPAFVGSATIFIIGLATASMRIERGVNALVARIPATG